MRTQRSFGLLVAGLLSIAALSACGDNKVTTYEPGKYSGARVVSPWESKQYGGDAKQWESATQARAQGQNEYTRIPAK